MLLPLADFEYAKLMDLIIYNTTRTFIISIPFSGGSNIVWPTVVLDVV